MSKSRLEVHLFGATLLLSLVAFVICVAIAVHSTVMAKKARRSVDVLAQMQAKLADLCLHGDISSCTALQKSGHGPEHAGLSASGYEERAGDYGVASVFIPFLFLTTFFAGRWMMAGKVQWDYAPPEQL